MTGPLYHLGRFCSRHHWPVIAVWVAAVVAVTAFAHSAGERTTDNLTLPGTGSTEATDLLQKGLPKQAYGSNPLVMKARSGTLDDGKNRQAVADTVTALTKVPHVTKAISPLSSQGSSFLSKDKTTGYVPVVLDVGPSDITKPQAQAVLGAAAPARRAGMQVAVSGYVGQQLSKPDTGSSDVIGLGAAVVILLFAFGTVTAMSLPIITAVLGLAGTLAVIGLLGHVMDVPSIAPTLATMIGLGVGIDYALFIVTRHKLQINDGMEIPESTARATATSGGAVVFAGTTVVIALCSLSLAGIPLVSNMGFAAAVSVVVAVLGASTLLPALLGALGSRINSLRVKLGRTHPDDHQPHGWARWAGGVARRPWISMVVAIAILLVLAAPIRKLELGQSDTGALPKSTTSRQAYDLLSKGFGVGTTGPLLVAVSFGTPANPDPKNIKAVDDQQSQLDSQQRELDRKQGQLNAGQAQLDQKRQQLAAAQEQAEQAQQQAQDRAGARGQSQGGRGGRQQGSRNRGGSEGPGRAGPDNRDGPSGAAVQQATEAAEAQLASSQQQIDSQQAELNSKQKQLDDAQKQLDQKRKQAESPAGDPRLQTLIHDVSKASGVKSVSPPTLSDDDRTAVFSAVPTTAPSSDATEKLVRHLRASVIPDALKGTDVKAYVGGQTAGYIDLADRISEKLPAMIGIVVALSFVVLLLAFRSLLLPLKAAVMNLLSVGAAYGIVTAVFQEGWGAQLIGLEGAIPIVSFVPLLMFAILFGLSMDYEVFLLSQIQDHYAEDGEPSKAVVDGLASTGRVITSAALIMVAVFTSFVLNGDPTVKEFGIGLAVAIAIDATIVRCLLVPAVMVLMGGAAWWMPRWMQRVVPRLSIEGGDYFARHDAR